MQTKKSISVKRLDPLAVLPTKAHEDDAGWDLYSNEDHKLFHGERNLFKTGIAMAIPRGYYGRIAPRSGLAFSFGLNVLAGVVDVGYRNEIGVILINHGESPCEVVRGERIAQIIFERVDEFQLKEVAELDDAKRGLGGFGSSGK